jgi:hypothetical protein
MKTAVAKLKSEYAEKAKELMCENENTAMDSSYILNNEEKLLKAISKNYFLYRSNQQQDWTVREVMWNCYDKWVVVDDIDPDVDFVDLEGMEGEFVGPIQVQVDHKVHFIDGY